MKLFLNFFSYSTILGEFLIFLLCIINFSCGIYSKKITGNYVLVRKPEKRNNFFPPDLLLIRQDGIFKYIISTDVAPAFVYQGIWQQKGRNVFFKKDNDLNIPKDTI